MSLCYCHPCTAQGRHKATVEKNKPAAKAVEKLQEKKPDTAVVYETQPAKEKAAADNSSNFKTKETVIVIKPAKGDKKEPAKAGKKDSVRIIYEDGSKKPPQPPPPVVARKIDTTIVIKPGRKPTPKDTIIVTDEETVKKDGSTKGVSVIKDNGLCQCVSFAIKAPDTLAYEDYINYTFILKNNCKETVWIHSGSFRFSVANFFGYPVKVIRKLDYVKRFDLPEYVKLLPGEEYEYRFADDAFFQYDISKGAQYKFSFIYNNTSNKYRAAPNKTYLCIQLKDKMIYVK